LLGRRGEGKGTQGGGRQQDREKASAHGDFKE
jgi:hypothetical protein